MTTPNTAQTCDVDALNMLLRGELSAVETYDQALAKFDDAAHKTALTKIRDEHSHAVQVLRERVRAFNGEPSTNSGPWGAFASTVTGAAKLVGPQATLSALKQGEQHGISDYEKALNNEGINAECRNTIRTDLHPRCTRHIAQLDSMIAALGG
jgi:demethoxyubiquinone hydroxylase (CLK1/Coq7/Cat5 family)